VTGSKFVRRALVMSLLRESRRRPHRSRKAPPPQC
jgi:hypothetical protein